MVFINEWLPNPNGPDTKGEFVELFNNGTAPVDLNGWILKTTAKKFFSLSGYSIAANGYLVLQKTETKLSLKNTGDSVFLYNAAGQLVDQSSYLGAAPSGQSFSRVYYPAENGAAVPQSFAWGTPSPGTANKVDLHNDISVARYPYNIVLNHPAPAPLDFFALLGGVAAILAALVVYFLKSDENLSELFFGGDG